MIITSTPERSHFLTQLTPIYYTFLLDILADFLSHLWVLYYNVYIVSRHYYENTNDHPNHSVPFGKIHSYDFVNITQVDKCVLLLIKITQRLLD
jgi:hypothetical protein